MIRFLNYLPAAMGSKPLPIRIDRLRIASGLNPLEQYSTPMTGRHWIGCGCLEDVAMEFMCTESPRCYLFTDRPSMIFMNFFQIVSEMCFATCFRRNRKSLEAPGAFRSGEILLAGFPLVRDQVHFLRVARFRQRVGERLRVGDDDDLRFPRHLFDERGERLDEAGVKTGLGFVEN